MAGILIAVVGVAVLVVAIVALRNPKHAGTTAGTDTRTVTPSASVTTSHKASPSTTKSSPKPSSSTTDVIGSLPLVVLNNTTTPNLARDAAQRFERAGWKVTSYDENYHNDIVSTVAYYDPTVAGAKAAATALQKQFPTIKRVVPKFEGLPDGPVVVVLTTDYQPT